MSAETIGQNLGFKGAKAVATATPYARKAASVAGNAAGRVGKAGLSAAGTVGRAGASALGSAASYATGIGQPQAIIVNSAPPASSLNGLGIIFGLLVGFFSLKNDNSWSTSIFFGVLTYAIFVLF